RRRSRSGARQHGEVGRKDSGTIGRSTRIDPEVAQGPRRLNRSFHTSGGQKPSARISTGRRLMKSKYSFKLMVPAILFGMVLSVPAFAQDSNAPASQQMHEA